jgi:DNA-binding SARP family transcriptional activator
MQSFRRGRTNACGCSRRPPGRQCSSIVRFKSLARPSGEEGAGRVAKMIVTLPPRKLPAFMTSGGVSEAVPARQHPGAHVAAPTTIRLLGPLQIEQADRVIDRFRTQKTGALLGYLAFHPQHAHAREALADLLWPDDRLDTARHKLRLALSSLRHQLEPPGVPAGAVIAATRLAVQLNPATVTTDVTQFEAALAAARRGRSSAEREPYLLTAAQLYRGELLSGYFEDWIHPERQRLAETLCDAMGELIALREQVGDLPGALQLACRLVSADRLRGESHHELIRLLLACRSPG